MKYYSYKNLKPTGWLEKQLEEQYQGLSGYLYKIWPDIYDSKWIGGTKEGWERLPYYLDGFIPLVYILDKNREKKIIKSYIDTILKNQKSDGWICPTGEDERKDYDLWALFLALKVLVVYYEYTEDSRIENAVYKALNNLYTLLNQKTLSNWASSRWFECLISIAWLYERKPEPWLIELAFKLKAQGLDYLTCSNLWKESKKVWSYETHVVNISMALKAEALFSKLTKSKQKGDAKKLLKVLDKYNSTAYGHFTGDECLGGNSPTRGSELCGIAEAMYSYELLFLITGDTFYLNRLDKLAFNGLPATISSSMWTHQYDQMVNQIACTKFSENPFGTNSNESNIFGLEPNFGCCTANFHQAWPKYARSVATFDDNNIYICSPVPFSIKTNDLELDVISEYPFRQKVIIKGKTLTPRTLKIRIPKNYKLISDLKEKNHFLSIDIDFDFSVEFQLVPLIKLEKRPSNLYCLNYGLLLFSLPINFKENMLEYTKDGIERKYPYCDYEILPTSSWNFSFIKKSDFDVIECDYDLPFDRKNPPLKIKTKLAQISWIESSPFIPSDSPSSTRIDEDEDVELQPYGSTTLRMTELPLIK